jgi:hypothetical protein
MCGGSVLSTSRCIPRIGTRLIASLLAPLSRSLLLQMA